MEKEIEAIIKKNLPAEVGENLKKVLEKGSSDALLVEKLAVKIDTLEEEIVKLNKSIEAYKEFDQRNAELEAKENLLKEGERVLEINTLKFQIAAEKEKTAFTKEVALGLVRNTVYKKSIFDSETQMPYQDDNGVWHYPTQVSKNLIENQQAE